MRRRWSPVDRRTRIAAALLLLYALTTVGLAVLDYDVAAREGYLRAPER